MRVPGRAVPGNLAPTMLLSQVKHALGQAQLGFPAVRMRHVFEEGVETVGGGQQARRAANPPRGLVGESGCTSNAPADIGHAPGEAGGRDQVLHRERSRRSRRTRRTSVVGGAGRACPRGKVTHLRVELGGCPLLGWLDHRPRLGQRLRAAPPDASDLGVQVAAIVGPALTVEAALQAAQGPEGGLQRARIRGPCRRREWWPGASARCQNAYDERACARGAAWANGPGTRGRWKDGLLPSWQLASLRNQRGEPTGGLAAAGP